MPWISVSNRSAQSAFIADLLERRASFSENCREYGISRQTGYKWWRRFKEAGHRGLRERSRRPRHLARAWPAWVVAAARKMRRKHRSWGAKKLRWALRQIWPRRPLPHIRTIERWLPRQPGRHRARPGPKVSLPARRLADRANAVWTIDFKGWFRTSDGSRISPLTVRDLYSRFVLLVRHIDQPSDRAVRLALSGLFRRRGLPRTIRVDNGSPFGGCGALGLSRLSVWWLQLGIQVEFTRPAHPQDNGAHEQMHRMLKAETATPSAANPHQQHRRFQRWVHQYNYRRPHESLGQRVPAHFYRASRKRWSARLPIWRYPSSQIPTRMVSSGGIIRWHGRTRMIGRAFAAQRVALSPGPLFHTVFLGSHLIGHLYPHDLGGMRPAHPRAHFKSRKGAGAAPPPP